MKAAPLLICCLLAGCGGPGLGLTEPEPWNSPELANGWSVNYQSGESSISMSDEGTQQVPGIGGALPASTFEQDGHVARVFWAEGVPTLAFDETQSSLLLFNQGRLEPSVVQVLFLPGMLRSGIAGRVLPADVPLAEWRAAFAAAGPGREVSIEWMRATGPWRATYSFDAEPWPKDVEVVACPQCPPDRYVRTMAVAGSGVWVMPTMPARWLDNYPDTGSLDPAPEFVVGRAVPLRTALADSANHSAVQAFFDNHEDWYLAKGQFTGSDLTGETSWDLGLASASSPDRLQWRISYPLGGLGAGLGPPTLDGISATTERPVGPGWSDRLSPVHLGAAPRAQHPCEATGPVQVVGLSYQVMPIESIPTASLAVTHRGVGPGCADADVVNVYGLSGPALITMAGAGISP